MSKFTNVDVLEVMERIVNATVRAYKDDFEIDKHIIEKSLRYAGKASRTFMWMARDLGTWCFPEKSVYTKGTVGNNAWTHYVGNKNIRMYTIEVSKVERGKVIGTIYALDKKKSENEVINHAILESGFDPFEGATIDDVLAKQKKARSRMREGNLEKYLRKLEKEAA